MKSGLLSILIYLLLPLHGYSNNFTCPKTQHDADTNQIVAFKLAGVLQSNMVIQRDKPFRIWGKGIAGHIITVKASWNSKTFSAKADTANNWIVQVPAAAATFKPQTIVAKDDGVNEITLNNILIGEVWVCSGQSNMAMPLDSLGGFPGFTGVPNYKAEIAAANYPAIRLIDVKVDFHDTPVSDLTYPATWTVCTPTSAARYSAAAYYFGRKLYTTLNVPVGLVVSCVSATSGEQWTSMKTIQSDSVLSSYYSGKKNAARLYNGMISPLKNLAIKGFIWYQGEGNSQDKPPGNYTLLSIKMIENWRRLFAQGPLPFYLVQLTPYAGDFFKTKPYGGDPTATYYAKFREAQANIRALKNTGVAITMDANSEIIFIHPREKKPVGERLALLALNNAYGMKAIQCEGPQYTSFSQNDAIVTVNFKHADGLTSTGPLKQYFYVAGTDHVFRLGNAVINGNRVKVTAPAGTPLPVQAVRYAFTSFPVTNIQNKYGLPMEPFRSDEWSDK